jgi:acyl carrier protein
MNRAEIYQRLNQVFSDVFDEDGIAVRPDLTAKDVAGWDSLTHIRLMLTVEKVFGIKFSASEIGMLNNVGDLVERIQSKISAKA